MFQTIKRHPLAIGLSIVLGLPLLLFVVWTTVSLNFTYAAGDRAGFLQKISKRGWLCKTWEGELQVTAFPGAAPEKFSFSVRSDSMAQALNGLLGKEVALHYDQHKGVPGSCFGDTEYYVTGARATGSP
ncbi:MAG TPA: hypothetical protein VGM82_11265 [Gemmatimonadaceae bacterium]